MTIHKRSIGRALAVTFIVVTVVAGGAAAGYAIGTARGLTSQAASNGNAGTQLAAFRASEHQGSAENPNTAVAGAAPTWSGDPYSDHFIGVSPDFQAGLSQAAVEDLAAFHASEHQGSNENLNAVDYSAFRASEHEGSSENPIVR